MKKNNKKLDNYQNYTNYSTNKRNNAGTKSIDVDDSDSEDNYPNSYSPQKSKEEKVKRLDKIKNQKYLGNKHKSNPDLISAKNKSSNKNYETEHKCPKKLKKFSYFSDSESSSPKLVSNDDINMNDLGNDNNKVIKIKKEEEDMIEFPYEFTEKIIDALTCEYCKGIYIKPYVINSIGCQHIFCLGCIMKMLEEKEIGICPKCKNQFFMKNIKYSEVTDFYVKTFFPQIPKIIEENNNLLNQFMESEAKKYTGSQISEDSNEVILKCEIIAYKFNIPEQKRLPDVKHNKFITTIKSDNEDIVSILKKQTIKRVNLKLREDELDIRFQNVEISRFINYKQFKSFLKPNQNGINTFYYSKK